MVRVFASLFFMAATLFAPVMAMAQGTPIGVVITAEGEGALVMRAAEGQAYPAKADDAVYLNDVLHTGPDGRMAILLIDDSQFTLGENSRLKIDEYVYDDENNTNNKARYSVMQGVFLYVSGMVAKKDVPDVKITTPYGGIGIRGTTVWGGLLDDEYSVFCADGEVTVETNRGRIRVGPGEGTVIRHPNSIPERAKTWGAPKVTRATDTVAIRDVEKSKERVAYHQQNRQDMLLKNREAVREKLGTPPTATPRAGSTKEMRPMKANPATEPTPGQNKIMMDEKKTITDKQDDAPQESAAPVTAPVEKAPAAVPATTLDPAAPPTPVAPAAPAAPAIEKPAAQPPAKTGAAEMPFPKPAVVEPVIPDNLPSDPAKRQEALERQSLESQPPAEAPAPVKKSWNPF
jgi:hypothetical protein